MKQISFILMVLSLVILGGVTALAAPQERGLLQPPPTPEPCSENKAFGDCFGINGVHEVIHE